MKMYGRRAREKTCCRWCHPWGGREKSQIKNDEERQWRREADDELSCRDRGHPDCQDEYDW